FFKIKNSWGAQWGDNGYIYLKRGGGGKGMCNVVEGISYPELSGSPKPTSNSPTPSTSYPSPTPSTKKPHCTKRPRTSRQPKPSTSSPYPSTSQGPSPKPSTSSPNPTNSPPSGTGMKDQLMFQTNKIRAAHQVPPVTWDDALAAKVQAYASTCPGFNHGGPSGPQNLASNDPCGEAGQQSCLKYAGGAWLWYVIEEKDWNYDTHKCNGDWLQCGHFSNLMNKNHKAMGCGWSNCGKGNNYVWCNYVADGKEDTVFPRLQGMTIKELEKSLTV
ncbi:hypothetical protein As57867_003722, partial [Aphanomyces stellatus]